MSKISPAAGKVICDAIHHADVVYRDKNGDELLVVTLGEITAGGEIKTMVPTPENIVIMVKT